MADFGHFDRDTEDQDIAREGLAASGNPTRGASPLALLKNKFQGLDKQRTKVLPVGARNGQTFWLELDLDVTEDEMDQYRSRADRASRADRRAGKRDISDALLSANLINERNVRVWADNPLDEDGNLLPDVSPVMDSEGDPITVHSEEWCEALGYPGDPIGGLRHLINDFTLTALFGTYSNFVNPEVDPTRA